MKPLSSGLSSLHLIHILLLLKKLRRLVTTPDNNENKKGNCNFCIFHSLVWPESVFKFIPWLLTAIYEIRMLVASFVMFVCSFTIYLIKKIYVAKVVNVINMYRVCTSFKLISLYVARSLTSPVHSAHTQSLRFCHGQTWNVARIRSSFAVRISHTIQCPQWIPYFPINFLWTQSEWIKVFKLSL